MIGTQLNASIMEHLVLDELQTMFSSRLLHYWRDKSQHEIDFVVDRSQGRVDAVEAKINPEAFDAKSLRQFRELHPNGNNYVVCPFVDTLYAIRRNGLTIYVCRPDQIGAELISPRRARRDTKDGMRRTLNPGDRICD